MFAPTEYLRWAEAWFARAPFDLARSGVNGPGKPPLDPPSDLERVGAWRELREHIAAYNGVAVDEALPAFGTTHALWLAYVALLAPGDEALIERVTYEPMHRIAEGVGAKVAWFDRVAPGFAIDPALVARATSERTRAVVVSDLHNPSGARADPEALREVARVAAVRGAHVVVDEVYAAFDSLCDPRGRWGMSRRRLAPNVVAVGSLTKCYGLGAHRVGWMLGPRHVIARAEDALLATLADPPLVWASLAVRAFERLPSYAEWARARIGRKRARVESWLAARSHLVWSAPREGLFGLAIDKRTRDDLTARIERGVRDHGVAVAPGAFFGVPNGFRIAWSCDESKLDDALDRLARVVD